MVFNSFSFLFAYLPVVLIAYYLVKRFFGKKAAGVLLIAASLVFYGWNYPKCLPVLIGSLIVNGVWGCFLCRKIRKPERKPGALGKGSSGGKFSDAGNRWLLGIGIALNVAVLAFFKYARLLPVFGEMELDAPGISFFTFTQIAFLVETYRGNIVPMGAGEYGLYVTFFPKLMQGPIMLPEDFQAQYRDAEGAAAGDKRTIFANLPLHQEITKDEWWDRLLRNIILISLGLFKKVILADTLGQAVTAGFTDVATLNRADAWVVMLSYTLQLYFDFSGYCDIAMGIASFFGYDLPLNFDSPYKAVNIMDFWKRWHRTLTGFLTKYVYIPLGGNRRGNTRMYLNFLIVFFVSGIWHGAGWQFVVWGMMHGVLYVITRAVLNLNRKKAVKPEDTAVEYTEETSHFAPYGLFRTLTRKVGTALQILLTFLYVNLAWVFFRASSVKEGLEFLRRLVEGGGGKVSRAVAETFNLDEFWYVIKILHLDQSQNSYFYVMILFLLACLILIWGMPNAVQIAKKCKLNAGIILLAAVLFAWSVISFSGVSTFLYFNF